ncbi:MAG: alpha/beta hydrolase [Planctomycetota bacterium]|nr:alpha/beta hydrolase [Planctomycetota bacterium]
MTPTVVLLHGLGRTHRSMSRLRRRLEREGWETWSMTYPSRRGSITESAEEVARRIQADLPNRPLVGVTHSMGGIIIRHLADRFDWRGCVLVAPPNGGSRAADWARRHRLLRWFFGQALEELAEAEAWPNPPSPNLVISGTRGWSWCSPPSWFFSRAGIFEDHDAHDGTVAVEETRHDRIDDYTEVHAGHSTIMSNQEVISRAVTWLNARRSQE